MVAKQNQSLRTVYAEGGRHAGVPQGLTAHFAISLPVCITAMLKEDLTPCNRVVFQQIGIAVCIIFEGCRVAWTRAVSETRGGKRPDSRCHTSRGISCKNRRRPLVFRGDSQELSRI
jgi:hypothetical protein